MIDPRADVDLASAAQTGDQQAWAALCHRHAPRLAAYLGARLRRPKVVEKLVEDAIVAAWTHLHELDKASEFPAFFRRVGANLALRWYREHSDEKLVEDFPAERVADAALAERLARLDAALGKLGDPERMALESRFRGGLSGEPLAESLHLPDAQAAQRQVDDALDALGRLLGPDGA